MIVNEVVAKALPDLLDEMLSHEGDDASFISWIRTRSAALCVQIIGEIEEGFIDGINDVLIFLKSMATDLLMASAPPQQANMAKGIMIPTLLRFIEKSWKESPRSQSSEAAPAKETTPAPKKESPKPTEAAKPKAQQQP